MRYFGFFLLIGLAGSGCAPADVAGDYTLAVTSDENACGFSNWQEDQVSEGIRLAVVQDGSQVQLDVGGLVGTALDLSVGSSLFAGEVSLTQVTAALIGDLESSQGGCRYTRTVDMNATLTGDALAGDLFWRPVTNHHADCGILETCRNRQRFSGSRPPGAE